jgi:hypothetical protein
MQNRPKRTARIPLPFMFHYRVLGCFRWLWAARNVDFRVKNVDSHLECGLLCILW